MREREGEKKRKKEREAAVFFCVNGLKKETADVFFFFNTTMADAPAESLAAGQRLMLRSCGVNNPSEGVYEAATEAIRDRCPDPKPLMQASDGREKTTNI